MPVPMCPGCRALLGPDEAVCPYCGWNLEQTEVRERGGHVERTVKRFGGLYAVLLFANVLLAVVTALLSARMARGGAGEGASLLPLLFRGAWSPRGDALDLLGANVPEHVLRGQVWRVLCPVFLHGGLLHIWFNMGALRNIGAAVEEAYGAGKALALYLLAGIAGSLASLAWFLHTGPEIHGGVHYLVPRIGASGAIIGFAGIVAALGFRVGGERGRSLWRPMLKSVGFILVLGLVLSWTGGPVRLDNSAHVGGFLFGLGAGFLCSFGVRSRGSPSAVRAWDAAAIVLSLLTVASFVPPAIAVMRAVR